MAEAAALAGLKTVGAAVLPHAVKYAKKTAIGLAKKGAGAVKTGVKNFIFKKSRTSKRHVPPQNKMIRAGKLMAAVKTNPHTKSGRGPSIVKKFARK